MKKRLYNEDGSVDSDGFQILLKAESFARKLMEEFPDVDFHDMEGIISNSVSTTIAYQILAWRDKEESK